MTPVRGLLLVLGLLVVTMAYILSPYSDVRSPGNSGIEFASILKRGDFETAYSLLCEEPQAQQSLELFTSTNGGDYRPFRLYPGSIFGSAAEHRFTDIDRSVDSSWKEYDLVNPDTTLTLRLQMVREAGLPFTSGDWKMCGIENRGERPTE